MSLKKHLLPKSTVEFVDIFPKQREIGLFRLVAESRLLQYCFCQQPYQYLIHVYYIPIVHSDYH